MMVVVTVIGRYFSEVKFSAVLENRKSARSACRHGALERMAPIPSRGRKIASDIPRCSA